MGRKDSMNFKAPPIDNYRKQIGKHDGRKDKEKLAPAQRRKHEKEMRSKAMTVKIQTYTLDRPSDVVLVLALILTFIASTYVILYYQLTSQPIAENTPSTQT